MYYKYSFQIQPSRLRLRPSRGFTLLELVIVLAIASILLAGAMPSIASLLRSVRLATVSSEFVTVANLARSEAIRRSARVVLCKSADGGSCAKNGGWEQGWLAFHDADRDGMRDDSELVIHRSSALSPDIVFSGNLNVTSYISYGPSGAASTPAGAFQAGTLTLCYRSQAPTQAHQVVINAVGRLRVQKVLVKTCG